MPAAAGSYDFGRLTRAPSQRFVVFVDDLDGLSEVERRFGRDDVVALSAEDVGSHVRTIRRDTLPADMDALALEHRRRPFAGVIHWREPNVVVATRVAERLGLSKVVSDPLLARDKLRMKDALRTSVRCAESMLVRTDEDIAGAPAGFFPGVLKPRYGFASICAVRVDDRRAALGELREKRNKLLTTRLDRVDVGVPADADFVLESFVGGTEHTVESFVTGGEVVLQIVSDKLPMAAPHFVERGDVMPSELDEPSQSRLREAARRGIAALGIRHGWTHAEIKLSDGEAWVMEIGARMGGGYTRDVVRQVYGLDMLHALFDYYAEGKAPALGPPRGSVLARRYLASGVTVAWDTKSSREVRANVVRLPRESASRRRGVFLGAPFSYEGTIAAYLFVGPNAAEAKRLSENADAALAPRRAEVPFPRAWYRAYLRGKRVLDLALSR